MPDGYVREDRYVLNMEGYVLADRHVRMGGDVSAGGASAEGCVPASADGKEAGDILSPASFWLSPD